jgi:hypothetical protein
MYGEAREQLPTLLTAALEVNYQLHAPVVLPPLYEPPMKAENRK